ncbi:phosphatase PAP2 family protein [Spongiimicrobium sp. 3-5]|uniref:phosphatase PAP2 family protein n=1 Tax=Spongiimicrobium sp. 3-5 TaxID=3332596 RepID=UPI0039807E01
MLKRLLEWDEETFVYLNSLGTEQFDFFWATITNIATWIPLFLLLAVFVFRKFPVKQALPIILTIVVLALFITGFTSIVKEVVGRLRPNNNEAINDIIRIVKNPQSLSFFSGHAASSFSITTLTVLFLRKRIKGVWFFYLWPLLFSYSRIYVGVHYPIDIFVGAVVGVLTAWLFYDLFKKFIVPYLGLDHP